MFNATHKGNAAVPCILIDSNGFRYHGRYSVRFNFFAYVQGGVTRYVDADRNGGALGFVIEWTL